MERQPTPTLTRRQYLRSGAVLSSAFSVLAGCQEGPSDATTGTQSTVPSTDASTPSETRTPTESPVRSASVTDQSSTPASSRGLGYADVVPVPPNQSDFEFTYVSVSELFARRDGAGSELLPDVTRDSVYPSLSGYEISYGELEYSVSMTLPSTSVAVVSGRLPRNEIVTAGRESGLSSDGMYGGYDVYSSEGKAFAISDETLVETASETSDPSILERTIDTVAGDEPSFYAANEDFRTFADALGTVPYVTGGLSPDSQTSQLDGDVGSGVRIALSGTTSVVTFVFLFEDAAAVDLRAVRDVVAERPRLRGYFADPNAAKVRRRGRTATVTGEFATSQSRPGETTTETPTVTPANEVDLAPLTTYTNETYAYRLAYPADWTVTDSVPADVSIAAQESPGELRISVTEEIGRSYSLNELVELSLTGIRVGMDDVEVLSRRDSTLDSGHPARVLVLGYDDQNDRAGPLWSTYLVTVRESTVFNVVFVVPEDAYTDAVGQAASRIVDSFTLLNQ